MLRYIFKLKLKKLFLLILFLISLIYIVKRLLNGNDKIPILLWWTPFSDNRIIDCDNKFRCFLTSHRSFKNDTNLGAYLFYGSNFNPYDLPIGNRHIPWAIFHEESPKNLALFLYEEGQSLFNITTTFDRHSDFPITLQYLKNIDFLIGKQYYVPIHKKNNFLKNLAPVLYIQSDCDTPIQRDVIVAKFMKYIKVDSYGTCLNNKKLPESLKRDNVLSSEYHKELMKFIANYKFVLSIENAECHDYITEKLWRPLAVGSVPIYLGSPSVRDWLPNNNSAILFHDFKGIKSVAEYVQLVNQNDKMYETFLDHKLKNAIDEKITNKLLKDSLSKGNFGISNDFDYTVPALECFVCKHVYEKGFKRRRGSVYNCLEPTDRNGQENWWKYHWRQGRYQAIALKELLEKQKNFTKEEYEQRVQYYSDLFKW